MGGRALVLEDFLVDLGTVHVHPGRRDYAELQLGAAHFEDMHGDVIAYGDDFAYSAA
jgi:hypothetical protein